MDRGRFDALTRTVAAVFTRRSSLSWLLALALAGGAVRADEAEAKKRRRKKRCKKRCGPCHHCKQGKCKLKPGVCPSGQVCLANGTCALTCPDDFSCFLDECSIIGCVTNTEGTSHCSGNIGPCEQMLPCTGTAQCPAGQQCLDVECPGRLRCVPLCASAIPL